MLPCSVLDSRDFRSLFFLPWHQSTPVPPMATTHVVIAATFLSESSRTSFLNLSLSPFLLFAVNFFPELSPSPALTQPQGQRFFCIASVISFLDRLKHKHYKGFTVTWPSRSWEGTTVCWTIAQQICHHLHHHYHHFIIIFLLHRSHLNHHRRFKRPLHLNMPNHHQSM